MQVDVSVTVNAPKAEVWRLVTDIANAANVITGIDKVEVLEQPAQGFKGFKWRETRTMFGKTAVETMWITDARDQVYYTTEARSHGSIYTTKVYLDDQGKAVELGMVFGAEAESMGAKIMSVVFGLLMKGSVKKALLKDLNDIKAAAEARK